MHIVAKVFDLVITDSEIQNETHKMSEVDSPQERKSALNRLIDRYLLLHQAMTTGLSVSDSEFDDALFESLEEMDTAPRDMEQTRNLEEQTRRRVIIRKYVHNYCFKSIEISEQQLLNFYEDQKEVFVIPETVHAAHILVCGSGPDSARKASRIRSEISTQEDFRRVCGTSSDCPSSPRCGDLGWFPRGRMISELEEVAFALRPGQISEAFKSRFGWHILLLIDRKPAQIASFEDVKDSLKARLVHLKREFLLMAHIRDLRNSYKAEIRILDPRYTH
ncbi:MAG TPA: peptidylprolyl isomerase [Candidatus Cloacimonadota bacterium]|jgi:parvulin-like peptidyl-prolyl isomerase|nr:peptidylprolyl isomerase [Candidatus Cloacimonadota bacterium]HOR58670.1 peptidylprolyl isomerase [Candidatus Cloacimonadota bacterium]HPB09147.1 peptidylprolyl isomerase [Candidatus Cloacimonadota bacterium]HQO44374.1 peptidylprolyl isomerase [Candidatus Cloacimonadota bacterium]HQP18271.1 peptidylprolyl isomerase [Candidatus Cloacimonadota bacterium]